MTADHSTKTRTRARPVTLPSPAAAPPRALLERRDGHDVGRDVRRLSRDALIAGGHKPMSPLKALRARCLDCCAGSAQEVRICTATACAIWPFRQGTNPWRKEPTAAQRAHTRTLAEKRSAEAGKQPSAGQNHATSASPGAHPPAAKLSTGETPVFEIPLFEMMTASAETEAQR